jgi:hydrogenase maturation protein HypF
VIGFALDGTGYGTDGQIWGGEVLTADYREFERVAHFDNVPMPGGEAAVREPWRMAVAYLAHHFGDEFVRWRVPFVEELDARDTDVLLRMIERGVNSPKTSSCGRLFDAVAALVGVRRAVNYEAQAAIELEMAMAPGAIEDAYPLDIASNNSPWIIDTKPMFEAMLCDLQSGVLPSLISQRFHNGLVESFARIAEMIRDARSLNRVCLSGGTFHNVYLLTHLQERLEQTGFQVFTHAEVPAGDGGLSLGQAMVAAHRCSSL